MRNNKNYLSITQLCAMGYSYNFSLWIHKTYPQYCDSNNKNRIYELYTAYKAGHNESLNERNI